MIFYKQEGGRMKPQTKASMKYNLKTYDRIEITVPKGDKAEIQAYAESKGVSVNQLIKELLKQAGVYKEDETDGNTKQ
jgi:predicted HicB family RNase H-like nuclease